MISDIAGFRPAQTRQPYSLDLDLERCIPLKMSIKQLLSYTCMQMRFGKKPTVSIFLLQYQRNARPFYC